MKIGDIATYISIAGAILVSFGLAWWANILWSISNPILIFHNYKIKEYSQMRMFLVFAIIAIFGVYYLW